MVESRHHLQLGRWVRVGILFLQKLVAKTRSQGLNSSRGPMPAADLLAHSFPTTCLWGTWTEALKPEGEGGLRPKQANEAWH